MGGACRELLSSAGSYHTENDIPDHEGQSQILTGIENIIPAGVRHQNLSDVGDGLVSCGGKYYIRAPNLTSISHSEGQFFPPSIACYAWVHQEILYFLGPT